MSSTSGNVGSLINFTIGRFPTNVTVTIRWDGTAFGSVFTNDDAQGMGNIKIPAAPMGAHTIKWTYGTWVASKVFTVKPRIKVTPSSNVQRGQTVNVSLRGYAAHETVRIRWIKNGSFVQIAQVTTSSTGSANIDVKVPTFVPNGSTSVRGDGTSGHAQTNAVTVSGGPISSSQVATPTPTASKTATPTASPATSTPTATVPAPTETPSPTATTSVETPTPEPTTIPEASPVP